jgi:hypothetical protein
VILFLEPVIPDMPLKETVWDNDSGPLWDIEESDKIGFTLSIL